MKIWLIIKIAAGIIVAAIAMFSGMLAYHVAVKPLGGVFAKIIPDAGAVLRETREEDFSKMLELAEIPDFEPGDRAFQKAHELIALGKIREGREAHGHHPCVFLLACHATGPPHRQHDESR